MIQVEQQKESVIEVVLRPGLDADELERELLRADRTCDVARRSMAFYLEEMSRRGMHQMLGFPSAAKYAQARLSCSDRQARYIITVGAALRELLVVDDAFNQGRLSWTKVRLLVSVCTTANESEWVAHAESVNCHQLEADVRNSDQGRPPRSNSKGTPSPRFSFSAKLSPLDYEVIEKARRKFRDEGGSDLDDGEFVLSLADYFLRGGGLANGRNSKTLNSNQRDRSRYVTNLTKCTACSKTEVKTEGGPIVLSESEAAAACCDAEHLGDVKDEPTPEPMRRRVLARDGQRCFHCHSPWDLHAHHITFRENFGKTIDSNLITTCKHCHGLIHDGLLVVNGTAPHKLVVKDRAGRLIHRKNRQTGIRVALENRKGGTRVPAKLKKSGTHVPEILAQSGTHVPENLPQSGTHVPDSAHRTGPKLKDLIGQKQVVKSLALACAAAKIENRLLRHVLLAGPPGLGKTTAARALSAELGVPFFEFIGASIDDIDELIVPEGSILFIDEIHALAKPIAEQFYGVMDERNISVVAATTDPDLMPRPLRDRFGMQEEFLSYSVEELAAIVTKTCKHILTRDAALIIAKAALGVPRRALALLAAAEDQRSVAQAVKISAALVLSALKLRGIDPNGLGPRHKQALKILNGSARPIGLLSLANRMGINVGVFRRTVEPELLKLGLIEVTPLGLRAG